LRLFVALELPEPVVAALATWGSGAEREGLRLVPRENLHVTLAFLGERPDEEADAIAGVLAGVAAPVEPLRVGEPAWLPPRRPGVLAVDLDDPEGACARLQAAVSASLVGLGVFTPEKRAFRPHVTVARVRKGAHVDKQLPQISDRMTFAAQALTLYRSRLGPKGASYLALARIPLS
jgi:RNA 2',3'-cyclic 3'-phosphodiesterase